MTKSILIGPSSFAEKDVTPIERLKKAGYEIVDNPYKRRLTKEELKSLLKQDVCGLIAGLEPLDRDVLMFSRLKVISRVGSGLTNVDLNAARELGIVVCSTPNGPTQAVAELTVGALLGLLRMIPQMSTALHNAKWEKQIGTQLQGKTVVIIGYGRIGCRVAELLHPFNINLIVVDPNIDSTILSYGKLMSLKEALQYADIVTLHNSGETCLIGENEISMMKEGAYLLNVARGSVVYETALIKGIKNGKIAGAWLDTFVEEPYKGELLNFQQVILTPHVGSYTAECRVGMENEAVDNLINTLETNK